MVEKTANGSIDLLKSIITDAAQLDAEMKSLSKSIVDQDDRIRVYLLSEIMHIEEHRNPTRLNTFFTNIRGSGARVNAMHTFIQLHANVKFNGTKLDNAGKEVAYNPETDKASLETRGYFEYYKMLPKRTKEAFKPKMESAVAKPWWQYRPEATPTDFDMDVAVQKFVQSLWRHAQKAKANDKLDISLLSDLTDLALKHGLKDLVPTVNNVTPPEEVKKAMYGIKPEAKAEDTNVEGDVNPNREGNPIANAQTEGQEEKPKNGRRGRKAAAAA